MFKASALRRPKRIRLSTLANRQLQHFFACKSAMDATYISLPLVSLDASGFGIPEGVAASVQVDLTGSLLIASDCRGRCEQHDANRGNAKLVPVMIGTLGRYLEIRRAVFPLVERTKMALASCSEAAATAAMATVSTVCVGRGWMALSSSYRGG